MSDAMAGRVTSIAALVVAGVSVFTAVQALQGFQRESRAKLIEKRIEACIGYTKIAAHVEEDLSRFIGSSLAYSASKKARRDKDKRKLLLELQSAMTQRIGELRISTYNLLVLFPEIGAERSQATAKSDPKLRPFVASDKARIPLIVLFPKLAAEKARPKIAPSAESVAKGAIRDLTALNNQVVDGIAGRAKLDPKDLGKKGSKVIDAMNATRRSCSSTVASLLKL